MASSSSDNQRRSTAVGVDNLKSFASSLKISLDQNRHLQKHILSALESLSHKKAENRRTASRLTRELHLEAEGITRGCSEVLADVAEQPAALRVYVKNVRQLLKKVLEGGDDSETTGNTPETTADKAPDNATDVTTDTTTAMTASATLDPVQEKAKRQSAMRPHKIGERWKRGPYRDFKRDFFSDPLGSTPKANPDTVKRRRLEAQVQDKQFLSHVSPRWIKEESRLLETLVLAEIATVAAQADTATIVVVAAAIVATAAAATDPWGEPTISVDFGKVATLLNEKQKPDPELPLRQPRTAQECEIQYQRMQHEKQPKLTKAEVAQVVEQVESLQETNPVDDTSIDWKAVGNGRSPWQCYAAYKKAKPPITNFAGKESSGKKKPLEWSRQQDELLFKYIAAMGPQFILEMSSGAEMSRKLFPDKTAKQILLRCSQTLVNPKLQAGTWTLREQRQLVLSHKIYRDDPQRVPNQFPQRSARSVREKWNRTLDPAYDKVRPFSRQEDLLLCQVIQTKLQEKTTRHSGIGWFEITREHFPDRRPEQLQNRWTLELASKEDLLRKIKVDLLAQQQQQTDGQTQDDFVLKVAKKPGKTTRQKK